jgi:hypothetical protein
MGTTRNPASGREVEMAARDVEMSGTRCGNERHAERQRAESSLDALGYFDPLLPLRRDSRCGPAWLARLVVTIPVPKVSLEC